MKRILVFSFLVFFLLGALPLQAEEAKTNEVNLYFFWGDGCPHCAKEEVFLKKMEKKYPNLTVYDFEVWYDSDGRKILRNVGELLNINVSGVPLTVIGTNHIVGYSTDETTGKEIERLINYYTENPIVDPVSKLLEPEEKPAPKIEMGSLKTITLPVFGEIDTEYISLPVLTAIIGGLDGFNPCAMWILIFLISFLVGMENKAKRWILGGVFIITSGAVYFLFMSAWLNLLIFLGFIVAVRIGIGVVALGAGGYNLKEFLKNKGNTCDTTSEKQKGKIMRRMEKAIHEKNFWLALIGIIVLAAGVNLIELICSAGFPAVYTQVLALHQLPTVSYYLYLLLYIFFFILDDLIIFFIAMKTLEVTGVTVKYTRASHLIGGILMLLIGILLIFKPEWLLFG